jgi:hypothetical protein
MKQINSLSNHNIVTIAIALLGGDTDHIDREDIAIKVNELAPGKFNWRKYPNRIDLEAVGVALRDAKKNKNGGLIIGDNTKGWMLSPNGFRWLSSLNTSDSEIDNTLEEKRSIAISSQVSERERLNQTTAYDLFLAGRESEITQQDFFQFARVNEYFKAKARERRFTIVDIAVAGDVSLSALWNYLKNKFL